MTSRPATRPCSTPCWRLSRGRRRSRSSILPAAPARRCAPSAGDCRRGRTGGWSTTTSDCSARRRRSGRPPDVTVAARAVDLVRDLELALDGPIDLITTSALLDLVSEDWLERLIIEAAARRLPLYAALSYDGRVSFDPAEPLRHGHRRGREPASARRQGVWSGARSGRRGERRRSSSSGLAIRSSRDRPIGRSVRPTRRSSARCCAALPMRRASCAIFRQRALRTGWRGGSSSSPPALRACASVTSISSRCRCRSAERRGRNRAALHRRGYGRASAP